MTPKNLLLALFGVLPLAACGCLSLGGRTTHVHDNPETAQRISLLEHRVGTLEQALRLDAPEPVNPIPAP